MSRAWQAERQAEREQQALDDAYASGEMSREEHNEATRQIEREMRDAYEADREDALERVRDEWGG